MRDHRVLPCEPEKACLLPADLRKRLPKNHLGLFVSDVVHTLDLIDITDRYRPLDLNCAAVLSFYGSSGRCPAAGAFLFPRKAPCGTH